MSLTGTIRRPDKGALGSVEEVKRLLADSFPGVRFTLVKEEPAGFAEARKHMSLFLRLWLAVLGKRERYPHWSGEYTEPGHASAEFYFETDEPLPWIRVTSYGQRAGLDGNLDRLTAVTGWVVVYPRF